MSTSHTSVERTATLQEVLLMKEDSTRHSIPISRDEIETMIAYVMETRNYSPATNPEWDFSIASPEFNFIRRSDTTSNLFRTRSWIKVPGVPPQVLFHIIRDPKQRVSFDKYYVRFESSRRVSSELDVLISEISGPIGISNREFVEWRRQHVSDPTVSRKDSLYAIELRSCDDDQCSPNIRPRTKAVERAETWLSGYVITWWFDQDQVLGSEILVMSQIDMRGMLPQMFVNIVGAVSAPTKWCRSLTEASRKFCKTNEINLDMTDDEIDSKLGIQRDVYNSSSVGSLRQVTGSSGSELAAAELRDTLEEVVGLPPLPITSKKVMDGAAIGLLVRTTSVSPSLAPTATDDTIPYDRCTVGSNDPTYAASSDYAESQIEAVDNESIVTAVVVKPPKILVMNSDDDFKVFSDTNIEKNEAGPTTTTHVVPEGLRYFLTSGTISLVGISLLAFSLTLTIWNTWRAITYVYSPLDHRFPLRCTLNLGLCAFAIIMVILANRNWFGDLGRGIRVLGNVLGGIGLWEFIESLVSYLTNLNSQIDLIIYAIWLLLCAIAVYVLYKVRNINIIDSSLLSPV